jgi:AbrB family looped-hinge helix DNA binding protein
MITTVTGKNQITIPAKLADQLDIHVGTRIEWSVGGDGILIARLLPGRGDLARKASGMGRPWITEGVDPIGELIKERDKSDSDKDPA